MWAEDGDFGIALKASGNECVFKPYPEMSHGWSCRGDVSDAAVKRDVELVMKDAGAFFGKYLSS